MKSELDNPNPGEDMSTQEEKQEEREKDGDWTPISFKVTPYGVFENLQVGRCGTVYIIMINESENRIVINRVLFGKEEYLDISDRVDPNTFGQGHAIVFQEVCKTLEQELRLLTGNRKAKLRTLLSETCSERRFYVHLPLLMLMGEPNFHELDVRPEHGIAKYIVELVA